MCSYRSGLKRHTWPWLTAVLVLAACTQQRQPPANLQALPEQYSSQSAPAAAPPEAWLDTFRTPVLHSLVDQALADNYLLSLQAAEVEVARQQARLVLADRLPELNSSLSARRLRPVTGGRVSTQFDVAVDLGLDIDVWGRLADQHRQAALNLAAARMDYLDARRSLVAQTVSAVFSAISAAQLQALFNSRLHNLRQSLDVIEQGYRSGLNEALDVYLAQTTVQQERANVASQHQAIFSANTSLQLLLAAYPDARLELPAELPALPPLTGTGLPVQLLQRRPDVQRAWLELLAADAGAAAAHKNLLPGVSFTTSLSDSDNAVRRLLDSGNLAWSASASVLQPLFQGGRLRALQAQAELRVVQAEQRYLDTVFSALAEVENELNNALSLEEQLQAFSAAQTNAEAALELAFDQYQRGLVTYTTVLESQRRAFDAQTTLVQLRNQQLQSRVILLQALGGAF